MTLCWVMSGFFLFVRCDVVLEMPYWFWFAKFDELLFVIKLLLPFKRCWNEISLPSIGLSNPITSNKFNGSGPSRMVESCLLLVFLRFPCSFRLSRKLKTNCCCLLNGIDEKMERGDFLLLENTIGSPLIFSPFNVLIKRTLLCVCLAVFEKEKLGTFPLISFAGPLGSLFSFRFCSSRLFVAVKDPVLVRL